MLFSAPPLALPFPGLEVSSSTVPNALSCNGLMGGRNFFGFTSPQEHATFRLQRNASLNPCDNCSCTSHTSTVAWPFIDQQPSKTTMLFFQSLLTQHARVFESELLVLLHNLRCASTMLFAADFDRHFVPKCLSFHPQAPRSSAISLNFAWFHLNICPLVRIYNCFSRNGVNGDFSVSTSLVHLFQQVWCPKTCC